MLTMTTSAIEFPFEIRRVNHNTYDLFTGKQWDEHVRGHKGRSSSYCLVGWLPHAILRQLHEILDSSMPINYGQSHEQTLNNCFNVL